MHVLCTEVFLDSIHSRAVFKTRVHTSVLGNLPYREISPIQGIALRKLDSFAIKTCSLVSDKVLIPLRTV